MEFNKFIWGLYKNSSEGKKAIGDYRSVKYFPNEEEDLVLFDQKEINKLIEAGLQNIVVGQKVNLSQLYLLSFKEEVFDKIRAKEIFTAWIQGGISYKNYKIIKEDIPDFWCSEIDIISNSLHAAYPEYFFPYFFFSTFNEFQAICDRYEISLPKIPKKKEWLARAQYYIDICDALHAFRIQNGLSPAELNALFYDFAPKEIAKSESRDMPTPSKAWFCGGNRGDFDFLDHASYEEDDRGWQGNADTRKGDIIVMYCLSPRSYIHSIWRAESDGFIDPFFHYYNMVYISHPIKVKPVPQKELINNEIFAVNPLVRKNLQGINGYPLAYQEYQELLQMLHGKGQDISLLPRIEPHQVEATAELAKERDVEIHLIEPFLERLGYTTKGWVRQMPVKMGRGERNFPDYCFEVNQKRGEETAAMVLEAKYSIPNNKELQLAYYQTKSYAMRLQSKIFAITAKEGIWIYDSKNNNFAYEKGKNYSWFYLENPDVFHEVLKLIGKKAIDK